MPLRIFPPFLSSFICSMRLSLLFLFFSNPLPPLSFCVLSKWLGPLENTKSTALFGMQQKKHKLQKKGWRRSRRWHYSGRRGAQKMTDKEQNRLSMSSKQKGEKVRQVKLRKGEIAAQFCISHNDKSLSSTSQKSEWKQKYNQIMNNIYFQIYQQGTTTIKLWC